MIPQRRQHADDQDRREPASSERTPFAVTPRQTLETMDLSEYDEDLIEFKRRAEADGVYVQIPRRGAVWTEPTPLHIEGEQLSEVIIRLRHGGE